MLKMEPVSPDGNITKQVLIKGNWGLKPSENSKCTITITECSSLNDINNYLIIIGDTDGDLWRSVELCLITMEIGEKSKFLILDSGKSIYLVIELLDLEFDGYIYDWNTTKKYNLAMHHKEKGNQLFKENNNKEAAFRFIKGLKIIHSILIDVESIPLSIDDVLVSDITNFKATLYNNLSSCYFKNGLWEAVINLCLKVLSYNSNNVKALYKLGVAYEHDANYEKSFEAFTKLLELEPGNKACTDHLNLVKNKLKKADIRVNNMVKKMFN